MLGDTPRINRVTSAWRSLGRASVVILTGQKNAEAPGGYRGPRSPRERTDQ